MRILLDENIPAKLKLDFGADFEVKSVREMRWQGTKNGELLGLIAREHFDYFIFGHRHLPLNIELNDGSRYINLGDWITHFTYAEFNGNTVELKKWQE